VSTLLIVPHAQALSTASTRVRSASTASTHFTRARAECGDQQRGGAALVTSHNPPSVHIIARERAHAAGTAHRHGIARQHREGAVMGAGALARQAARLEPVPHAAGHSGCAGAAMGSGPRSQLSRIPASHRNQRCRACGGPGPRGRCSLRGQGLDDRSSREGSSAWTRGQGARVPSPLRLATMSVWATSSVRHGTGAAAYTAATGYPRAGGLLAPGL
jgi:hypothetical protein